MGFAFEVCQLFFFRWTLCSRDVTYHCQQCWFCFSLVGACLHLSHAVLYSLGWFTVYSPYIQSEVLSFNFWRAEKLHTLLWIILHQRIVFSVDLFLLTWAKGNGWLCFSGTRENVFHSEVICYIFWDIYTLREKRAEFSKNLNLFYLIYFFVLYNFIFFSPLQQYKTLCWLSMNCLYSTVKRWNYGL